VTDLSKQRLLDLASEKLSDAKLLQSNDRFGNAYYLAGCDRTVVEGGDIIEISS
jgi:hypothetical protein